MDTILETHENQHDERRDADCPICERAAELAAAAWDSTGTNDLAVSEWKAAHSV